jgi:hypothetical protein
MRELLRLPQNVVTSSSTVLANATRQQLEVVTDWDNLLGSHKIGEPQAKAAAAFSLAD